MPERPTGNRISIRNHTKVTWRDEVKATVVVRVRKEGCKSREAKNADNHPRLRGKAYQLDRIKILKIKG